MAVGTLLTLFFIAWTVRQQGKALSLQIKQLQDLEDSREEARAEAERSRQEYKTRRVRNVRVKPHTLRAFTPSEHAQPGMSPFRRLTGLINDAILEHLREEGRDVRAVKWHAAAVQVHNQTQEVIYNVSSHGDELTRPTWIWRENVGVLLDIYELDQLAPDTTAWFVWASLDERDLATKHAEIRFSDEDGARWARDLHAHTTRVDHLPA